MLFYFNRITHTVILEDPFSDPDGLTIPDRSPEPPLEVLQVILFFLLFNIYLFLTIYEYSFRVIELELTKTSLKM